MSAEMNWRGNEVKRAVRTARDQALFDAAGMARQEANKTVPIQEGTLQRSGGVHVENGQAAVFYDVPYAVTVHESVDMVPSAPGRRPKWLELTLQEQQSRIASILQRGVGGAFR